MAQTWLRAVTDMTASCHGTRSSQLMHTFISELISTIWAVTSSSQPPSWIKWYKHKCEMTFQDLSLCAQVNDICQLWISLIHISQNNFNNSSHMKNFMIAKTTIKLWVGSHELVKSVYEIRINSNLSLTWGIHLNTAVYSTVIEGISYIKPQFKSLINIINEGSDINEHSSEWRQWHNKWI